jgi:hypothetical protein
MKILNITLTTLLALATPLLFLPQAMAGSGDTSWMLKAKYGIFMHYQYRILLGYSYGTKSLQTKPEFPPLSEMTAEGWNRFVDGFDVKGFADQMAEGQVGWVLFCIDDHYFGWPCAPNKAFDEYTGYAPGEKCSRRDLIGEVADALGDRGVKLICYYAGLNGCMRDPKSFTGLMDDGDNRTPPSAESRRRRIAVLKEFADRYKDKVAGWWFDAVMPDSYQEQPNDWWAIESVVHSANLKSVIAFSWGRNRQACLCKGVDDFISGDSYTRQDLTKMTPKNMLTQNGILWHGKIYCGNVYHGQGDANQFTDQELIDWIKTCNRQGGVCTLDWPFDPKTGLIKEFGFKQMIAIRNGVKGT